MAAKLELENNKWSVEFQKGRQDLEITPTSNKEAVNIYKCDDVVLQIKGKVSSITINNSTKVGLVFQDVIASVEVINSKKVQLQAAGVISNIQLDNVHGATVYLTNQNKKDVEIITSNVTEINVVTPGPNEDSDPKEQPIPQQFVSKFSGDNLITTPTEHVGV